MLDSGNQTTRGWSISLLPRKTGWSSPGRWHAINVPTSTFVMAFTESHAWSLVLWGMRFCWSYHHSYSKTSTDPPLIQRKQQKTHGIAQAYRWWPLQTFLLASLLEKVHWQCLVPTSSRLRLRKQHSPASSSYLAYIPFSVSISHVPVTNCQPVKVIEIEVF